MIKFRIREDVINELGKSNDKKRLENSMGFKDLAENRVMKDKKQGSNEKVREILKEIRQLNSLISKDIAHQTIKEEEDENKDSIIRTINESKAIPIYLAELGGELDDLIHIEGELSKYKPGVSLSYVSRWCQATFTHFRYYKSQWKSIYGLRKPLVSIPFKYVESIQRVEVKLPVKSKQQVYQFEIFLKKDISLSLIARNADYSYEKVGNNNLTPRNYCLSVKPVQQSKKTLKNSQSCYIDTQTDTNSSKLSPVNIIKDGHLMRNKVFNNKLKPQCKQLIYEPETIEYQEMTFKDEKQLRRFKRFSDKYKEQAKMVTITEKISTKNPSGWIATLASKVLVNAIDYNTWTNRECEWYEAEGRFLFGCTDLTLCNKWVVVLNWLLSEFNSLN